jgi:hypothetical protein
MLALFHTNPADARIQDSSSRPSARALLNHPWITNHYNEGKDDAGGRVGVAAEAGRAAVEDEDWDNDFPDTVAAKSLSVRLICIFVQSA